MSDKKTVTVGAPSLKFIAKVLQQVGAIKNLPNLIALSHDISTRGVAVTEKDLLVIKPTQELLESMADALSMQPDLEDHTAHYLQRMRNIFNVVANHSARVESLSIEQAMEPLIDWLKYHKGVVTSVKIEYDVKSVKHLDGDLNVTQEN